MSKLKNPNELTLKPIPSGKGVQNQSYQVVIQNPQRALSELRSTFKDSPQTILSNSKANFQPVDANGKKLDKADLREGSFVKIDIVGPMNNSFVKVTSTASNDESFSYTFGTLEGHIEAGKITFSARQDDDGKIIFTINSVSKVDMGIAPEGFSRKQQKQSWEEVLDNTVKFLQGNELDRRIDIFEQR